MSEPVFDSPSGTAEVASRSRHLAVSGLLAALLATSAWLTVPLASVPFTLQTFVVVLIALLLPPSWAAATVGVYLMLGALGAPVFASGNAGIGALAGPTGGYLIGFLVGATLGAIARCALTRAGVKPIVAHIAAAVVTVAAIYALGWLQLAFVTDSSLLEAFAVGVAPFVLVDIVKAAVAIGVASVLKRAGVAVS